MARVMVFRDMARERLAGAPGLGDRRRSRMLELIRVLTNVALVGYSYEETDTAAIALTVYRNVGRRTIQRDVRGLLEHGLLVESDGQMAPNLDLVDQFAADA